MSDRYKSKKLEIYPSPNALEESPPMYRQLRLYGIFYM